MKVTKVHDEEGRIVTTDDGKVREVRKGQRAYVGDRYAAGHIIPVGAVTVDEPQQACGRNARKAEQ